jgi:RNase P/RNase MRP subunit p29
MRDEAVRRVTDAELVKEHGLEGLLVGENTNTVKISNKQRTIKKRKK